MGERFSRHAEERAFQRRISMEDVALVLRYGKEIHRAGAMFIFLGRKDIPDDLRHDQRVARLEGLTLIMSSDCRKVITVYRNHGAIREIKRKLKRYQPAGRHSWH